MVLTSILGSGGLLLLLIGLHELVELHEVLFSPVRLEALYQHQEELFQAALILHRVVR